MIALLRKELRIMLRERRGWLVPVIYAALLASVAYLLLGGFDGSPRDTTEQGKVLAGVVAVVQTLAVIIFAPLAGAAGVAGERERGTLTTLLVSPANRAAIGVAKLVAGTLYVLYLVAASLPVAAVALLLGGPDAAALLGIYTTHALLAFALVALGLAVSTTFQRTWTATLAAIGLALAPVALTLALHAWIFGFERDQGNHGFLYFNPGYSLYLFFGSDSVGASQAAWLGHYGAMLLLGGLGLAVTLLRLRKMTR